MIKILHTSDWHLGKRLAHILRIEEQQEVLDEICEIADNQNVDIVVVAGDLFDTFNPSTDAVELFYATLKRLSAHGTRPVIAIAGNHDSPDRIEAPNPLARDNGIILIGYPKTNYTVGNAEMHFKITQSHESFIEITLKDGQKLRIITAPFANEFRLQEAFLIQKDVETVNFLTDYWKKIAETYCDNQGVNILVGHHLFLPYAQTQVEEPDDEKPIQAISALLPISTIPKQIQYVALGHLHRFQTISTKPTIVYSGSPLAYSFSEAMQKKYVIILDIENDMPPVLNPIELQKPLMLIRKKFDSSSLASHWLQNNQNCLVELTIVSNTYLTPLEIKSLHDCHKGIVSIIPEVHLDNSVLFTENISDKEKTMYEHFEDYFMSKKNGQKPNTEVKDLFYKIVASSK